jgi:hypothetical protein
VAFQRLHSEFLAHGRDDLVRPAALASDGSGGNAPPQIFGGPTFEALAPATEAACPQVRAGIGLNRVVKGSGHRGCQFV